MKKNYPLQLRRGKHWQGFATFARSAAALALILTNGSQARAANTYVQGRAEVTSTSEQTAAKLPIRVWKNKQGALRGVVVAVHGLTQHAGTFDTFANQLSQTGFTFVGLDMRGHGKWYHTAPWSDTGKTCDFKQSVVDMVNLISQIRAHLPNTPIYCLGESVGSAVAIRVASQRPDLINGLILVSSGTKTRAYSPFMVAGDFFKGIEALHKQMDVTRYIMRYSSNENRICTGMVCDPLSRRTLTPIEVLKTKYILSTTPAIAKKLSPKLAVLCITGAQDHIVDPGSVKRMFKTLKCSDKKLVWLPDCGHVLLGTRFLDADVVNSIDSWLTKEAYIASMSQPSDTELVAHDLPHLEVN
jgi:alpha-beta hydrolase superfamily lysophospholipase